MCKTPVVFTELRREKDGHGEQSVALRNIVLQSEERERERERKAVLRNQLAKAGGPKSWSTSSAKVDFHNNDLFSKQRITVQKWFLFPTKIMFGSRAKQRHDLKCH